MATCIADGWTWMSIIYRRIELPKNLALNNQSLQLASRSFAAKLYGEPEWNWVFTEKRARRDATRRGRRTYACRRNPSNREKNCQQTHTLLYFRENCKIALTLVLLDVLALLGTPQRLRTYEIAAIYLQPLVTILCLLIFILLEPGTLGIHSNKLLLYTPLFTPLYNVILYCTVHTPSSGPRGWEPSYTICTRMNEWCTSHVALGRRKKMLTV